MPYNTMEPGVLNGNCSHSHIPYNAASLPLKNIHSKLRWLWWSFQTLLPGHDTTMTVYIVVF